MISLKNKRANDGGTSESSVAIILVVLVLIVGLIALAVISAPKIYDAIKGLPGFGGGEKDQGNNPPVQPLEYQKPNSCIYNFYWSDVSGVALSTSLKKSAKQDDPFYIALSINDDFEKNPDCKDYSVVVEATEKGSFIISQSFYSLGLIDKENIKIIEGKKFYITSWYLREQDSYWKSLGDNWLALKLKAIFGSQTYKFYIRDNKKEIIRLGDTIHVK